ncbi:MAG: nucleotidyltransferase domain-containing protein [Firmicutes bacterium HGW-Firmicutes-13]|nr:MAG: nucleotidyltransferase domain-containing protein [Firmicutes bacterium HGW-Firmicutes-13]
MDKNIIDKRYAVNEEQYKKILNELQDVLAQEENILFAYLHGSFVNFVNFGDIDIAVYLKNVPDDKLDIMTYEFNLEKTIEKKTLYPVDVRILNTAPPSFKYSVIKNGIRLIEKDENKRVDFETMTLKIYFDFLPFRKRYFREALNREV